MVPGSLLARHNDAHTAFATGASGSFQVEFSVPLMLPDGVAALRLAPGNADRARAFPPSQAAPMSAACATDGSKAQ